MNSEGDEKIKKKGFRKRLIKILLNVFFITFFVVIIKLFLAETLIVADDFMEETLHKGDCVLINKAAYKIKTPSELPFVDRKFRQRTIMNISEPDNGDLIYLKLPQPNLYNIEYLLSRCVGTPGDTIMISDKNLLVNNKKAVFTDKIEYSRKYSIPYGIEEKEFYFNNRGWNQDNFGPLVVPKAGDKIKISSKNIEFYKNFIQQDDFRNSVELKNDRILINGKTVREYKVRNNYYFILGDNRDFSIDSRYIGYIKEKSIIGKAELVYWSFNDEKSAKENLIPLGSVRWDRIFYILN